MKKRFIHTLLLLMSAPLVFSSTAQPSTEAAHVGSYGLRVSLTDEMPAYVRDNLTINEPRYRARFHLNASSLVLPEGVPLDVFVGRDSAGKEQFRLSLTSTAGNLSLGVFVSEFGDPKAYRSVVASVPFPDQWHSLEIDWQSGATGHFDLWLNGVRMMQYPVNNPSTHIAVVYLGAVQGLVTGMSGDIDFDEFVSQRQCLIGTLTCDVNCMINGVGAQWPNPSVLELISLNNQVCP